MRKIRKNIDFSIKKLKFFGVIVKKILFLSIIFMFFLNQAWTMDLINKLDARAQGRPVDMYAHFIKQCQLSLFALDRVDDPESIVRNNQLLQHLIAIHNDNVLLAKESAVEEFTIYPGLYFPPSYINLLVDFGIQNFDIFAERLKSTLAVFSCYSRDIPLDCYQALAVNACWLWILQLRSAMLQETTREVFVELANTIMSMAVMMMTKLQVIDGLELVFNVLYKELNTPRLFALRELELFSEHFKSVLKVADYILSHNDEDALYDQYLAFLNAIPGFFPIKEQESFSFIRNNLLKHIVFSYFYTDEPSDEAEAQAIADEYLTVIINHKNKLKTLGIAGQISMGLNRSPYLFNDSRVISLLKYFNSEEDFLFVNESDLSDLGEDQMCIIS